MTIVQNTLTLPNGDAVVGGTVKIALVVNGFTSSGHVEILQVAMVKTSRAGLWSVNLTPQSQIDPANTYYEVTHPDGEVLSFVVNDAAGPLWLRNCLVQNPASPNNVYAGLHSFTSPDNSIVIGGTLSDPTVEVGNIGGTYATTAALASEATTRAAADTTNATAITNEATRATAAEALRMPVALVDSGSGYPARPGSTPTGGAYYIGSNAPSDQTTGDLWLAKPPTPRQVIYCDDAYTDEWMQAIRILGYYSSIGTIQVLAVSIDTTNVPIVLQPAAVDAALRHEGIVCPIGQVSSTFDDHGGITVTQQSIATNHPHSNWFTGAPDAATVLRTALVAAPGKVDLICAGFLSSLFALRSSAADGISPLTGDQLIAAKVNKVWVMGGDYPTGTEHNFANSAKAIAASSGVINTWNATFPGIPVTYLGFTTGSTPLTGDNLLTSVPPSDPILQEMINLGYQATGRSCWDPLLVYLACIGDEVTAGFSKTQGQNSVNASTGANTFTPGAGNQFYVTKVSSDAAFKATLNALLVPGEWPIPTYGDQRWTGSQWVPKDPRNAAPKWRNNQQRSLRQSTLQLIDGWRAGRITGVTDGTALASWPSSRASGGLALAQATGGNKPTYHATGGYQGRPYVGFAGSQFMATASNEPLTDPEYTVYARVNWAVLPPSVQSVVTMDGTSAAPANRVFRIDGLNTGPAQGVYWTGLGGGHTLSSPENLLANTWHLLCFRHDLINGPQVGIDGQFSALSTPWLAAIGIGPMNVIVGASTSAGAQSLIASLAEVRIYAGCHSDGQYAAVAATM